MGHESAKNEWAHFLSDGPKVVEADGFQAAGQIWPDVGFVYGLLRSHKQVFDQTKDAYVYSAFWWRRYLPALNVCAPRCLFVLAAC